MLRLDFLEEIRVKRVLVGAVGLLIWGFFIGLKANIEAVECSTTLTKAAGSKATGDIPKAALHALYFSPEMTELAASFGFKKPGFGREEPKVGWMDLNLTFMNYFLDFYLGLKKSPELYSAFMAWAHKLEAAYQREVDLYWNLEIKNAIDGGPRKVGKLELNPLRDPNREEIFKKVLGENPWNYEGKIFTVAKAKATLGAKVKSAAKTIPIKWH
jgi:hypothetical protein